MQINKIKDHINQQKRQKNKNIYIQKIINKNIKKYINKKLYNLLNNKIYIE